MTWRLALRLSSGLTSGLLFGLLTLTALPAQAASASAEQAALWREQARALEHGEGVVRDADAAMALYCQAAVAGDMLARYNLGWIYANGRGVARDDAQAAYFFELAANQGDEPARRMLASVGPQSRKPACVTHIEAELAAKQQAMAQQVAEAAEREALDNRYKSLIHNAQRRQIYAIVQRLAPEYGIHPALAVALIRAESNFDPQAVSEKNAQGLMQLIPETAARFRVTKPFDPEQNIRGGMAYLRWLLAYFQGDVDLTVAAYNAGEGAVNRFGGVPPYPETQGYLKRIREVFHLPTHPFDQRITAPSPMLRAVLAKPRT
jgi:soluble lytic murein transglycosylase-like protein